MRRLARVSAATAFACGAIGNCAHAQDGPAELEARYAKARAGEGTYRDGYSPIEQFHRALPGEIGQTPDLTAALRAAAQWSKLYPESVPAATHHAFVLLGKARFPFVSNHLQDADDALAQAGAELERVRQAGQDDSMWQTAHLWVGGRSGWSTARVLAAVRDATAVREPGRLLFESAVIAMDPADTVPRTEIAALARLAVDRTRSREGLSMYSVVYIKAAEFDLSMRNAPFSANAMDWSTMDASLADAQARHPSPELLSHNAALACKAADWRRAANLLGRLGEMVRSNIFRYWGGATLYERCTANVSAFTRRSGSRLPAFEAART